MISMFALEFHSSMARSELAKLQREIIHCEACPRLRQHCQHVAEIKRRAYQDWEYWGKPVPSFGDENARLLLIGLAPGAHGANRTGQMFTGDASGDFLFRALHKAGFASQAECRSKADGLKLIDAYITGAGRCAPPGNKPNPDELANCRPYLERELKLLKNLKAIVVLGRIAFDTYFSILRDHGEVSTPSSYKFEHGLVHDLRPWVICSYHPSQQNTQTGRLTEGMFQNVFETARRLIAL